MDTQQLETRKAEANELMKAQSYAQAAELYSSIVLTLFPSSSEGEDDSEELNDEKRLCIASLNNLSMAYQKMGEHGLCLDSCSKSITLDCANLKAYYRRALSYLALAKEEEETTKIKPKKGTVVSEKWDLAMLDAEAILKIESENAQAKKLKNDIRKDKLDAETKRKYNLHDVPSSREEKNSNFKGFPKDPHMRTPEVPPVPSVSHADIKNFIIDQTERAEAEKKKADEEHASESLKEFQEQQTEAYKKSSGYVFLDPNWAPASSTPQSANDGAAAADGGNAVPTGSTNEKKPSFRDLLSKAKSKSGERERLSRQEKAEKSKKIEESVKVKGALEELQSAEDVAKSTVLSTLAMKEMVGASRTKGSDSVKERLGKSREMKTMKSELKQVGDSSSAWEELASMEESALLQVRERLIRAKK